MISEEGYGDCVCSGLVLQIRVTEQWVKMVRNGRIYTTSQCNLTMINRSRLGVIDKNRLFHLKIEYYVIEAQCHT